MRVTTGHARVRGEAHRVRGEEGMRVVPGRIAHTPGAVAEGV
ncbi:hypothetical protein [Streptomyces olivaceus]